jgi:RimJ/RimL family protein N-acetyltransferase
MLGDIEKRSQGLGTEALRLTCQLGFSQLDLQRIVLEVKPNNLAAIAAYEKTGFVQQSSEPHMIKMELNVTQWTPDANPFSNEIS